MGTKSNEVILAEAVRDNGIINGMNGHCPDYWCAYCNGTTEDLSASPGYLPNDLHDLDCPYLVAIKVLGE